MSHATGNSSFCVASQASREAQRPRTFESFLVLHEEAKTARIAFAFPVKGHIILSRFPNLMQFCFPEPEGERFVGEHNFTFVLTNDSGIRTFGFCTRCVNGDVFVVLSRFSWQRVFSSLVYTFRANGASTKVIEDFYNLPIPRPGQLFAGMAVCRPQDDLCTFIDAAPADMLATFSLDDLFTTIAALLMENHVVVVGPNFSVVSRVCLSLLALLSPFEWQHVLIPVLPHDLIEVLASPTPYLVGVLTAQAAELERVAIDAVTVVRLGQDGCCCEVMVFPEEAQRPSLPRVSFPSAFRLKLQALSASRSRLEGHRLMRSLSHFYSELFGAVICGAVSESAFLSRAPPAHRAFFESVLRTQQYEQLKGEIAAKMATDEWLADDFLLPVARAHPALFAGADATRAASVASDVSSRAPSTISMSTVAGGFSAMSILRMFGAGCGRAVGDPEGEGDVEMADRGRSI